MPDNEEFLEIYVNDELHVTVRMLPGDDIKVEVADVSTERWKPGGETIYHRKPNSKGRE